MPDVSQVNVGGASRVKVAAVAFLAIASSLGAGYFFSVVDLFLGTTFALIFIIVFTLQTFFISDKGTLALFTLLEAITLGAPFYRAPTFYYGLLVLILFVMFYLGSASGIRELSNALKVPFFRIARIVLVSAITALTLFISSMYMGFGGSGYLSDAQIKSFIGLNIDPVIKVFIPTYTPKTSVQKLLTQIALNTLGPNERGLLNQLPPSQQDEAIGPVIGKLAKEVEGYLGVPISLKSNLSQTIFDAAHSRLSKIESDAKIILSIVLLVVVWFLINSSATLLYYPVVIFIYFIYEILFMAGFASMQLESRNREVIVLR